MSIAWNKEDYLGSVLKTMSKIYDGSYLQNLLFALGRQLFFQKSSIIDIWDKVFKNGPSKICERYPLKKFKGYGLLSRLSPTNFTWSILEYFEPFDKVLKMPPYLKKFKNQVRDEKTDSMILLFHRWELLSDVLIWFMFGIAYLK